MESMMWYVADGIGSEAAGELLPPEKPDDATIKLAPWKRLKLPVSAPNAFLPFTLNSMWYCESVMSHSFRIANAPPVPAAAIRFPAAVQRFQACRNSCLA